ncbi:uncharacterized protein LOC117170880 [Belonocnema kinseyi]|uniref:uncharacterized protein LOC117170880 n=1 Tax=Belonocnema kinseyi TaxID=2817044 RepID=UPI00143D34AB|nr:uncharacterized protein LOC117170880 [Belonocnema kinseyi]
MANEQLVILNKKRFDDIQDHIELSDTETPHIDLVLDRYAVQDDYLEIVADGQRLLASTQPADQSTGTIDRTLDVQQTKRRVKLPVATLPTFSGRYAEWLAFRDSFTSLIHDQTDLTNVEKLKYLKSALKADEAQKISVFSITEENYNGAWQLLEKTCQDTRIIISRHLSLIMRLPVQEKQTSEGLIKLADDTQQHMLSLASLGVKISEEILVQNIEEKLHKTTLEKWDETLKRNKFPKLDDMLEFLYRTATRLSQREFQNKSLSKDTSSTPGSSGNQRNAKTAFLTSTIKPCPACRCKTHPLFRCEKFRSFSIPTRIQVVQDASLCQILTRSTGNSDRYISLTTKIPMNQLITSAVLYSLDKKRRPIRYRALLDTCSSTNFIKEKLATALRLPKKRCSVPVGALNNLTTVAKAVVTITIRSLHSSYERTLSFLTIPQIAKLVPNDIIPREVIKIPPNIQLADPTFHLPSKVDMLLGSGPSLPMFCGGQIILSDRAGDLIIQKTELGLIAGENVNSMSLTTSRAIKCNFAELRSEISKFWELEEGFSQIHLSPEEIACEEHFRVHTTRNYIGRYIVALPFRQNHDRLGESRYVASKRLNSLEGRFKHQPELRSQYLDVIEEYLTLGHMSPIQDQGEFGFYLPLHAVFKEVSSTTRVRVVFDCSAKSESGLSLNDTLMVGPTLQDDILSHIHRLRFHIYILTGDIEKMYRQFEIRDEDRRFQRILWRRDGINLDSLQLYMVTFGISSSPFLATRAIKQLINDEGHQHPKAAVVLERDLYVDDLITGAETIEEGVQIRDSLIKLLNLGCLTMRQWASNDINLLRGIPDSSINKKIQFNDGETLKTLGVSWNSSTDSIIYSVHSPVLKSKITKRTVLSELAKLFDPLGLLGPIILFAKIIMEKLWELKVDWDESLPNNIHKTWVEFHSEITLLSDLHFERKVIVNGAIDVQLHGFCAASEKGYGSFIYIKSKNSQENSQRGPLRASEINNAEKAIIRATQITHFAEEMNDLKIGRRVHKKRKLTSLDPFIDRDGIIRRVHLVTLESIIADIATEGFLAALRRFTARRGRPSVIYSDNGSNFIGANNELNDIKCFLQSEMHNERVSHVLSDQGVEWRFISPLSPHFGGIWEATVKVFKHHFKRVIGDVLFTFEELNTFSIKVEAILNSRPLTSISCDPNDMLALTPGHFIIGDSLTNLPEVDLTSASPSAPARWLHIQKMRQHFWRRWHKEYLNELNIRHKWKNGEHQIKVGSIVLLKEDNILPMQWPMGRVIETFPGSDGIVRTVNVKTAKISSNET